MVWIPLSKSSSDLPGMFTQWLKSHEQECLHFQNKKDSILRKWYRLLEQYIPPFPLNGVLLTAEDDQVNIIPLKYPVKRGGVSNLTNGWTSLWKDLVFEPVSRIVELLPSHIKVYEVRGAEPELTIDLPIHNQPRYNILRGCVAYLIRENRKEPGPLLIHGTGDGIMELDCWVLSAYFPLEVIWKTEKEHNCRSWWQHMNRRGLVKDWGELWTIRHKDIADKHGKWIDQENDIYNALQKNRLDTILLPRNYSTALLKNEQIKQIIQYQTSIRYVMANKMSAIVK